MLAPIWVSSRLVIARCKSVMLERAKAPPVCLCVGVFGGGGVIMSAPGGAGVYPSNGIIRLLSFVGDRIATDIVLA